MNRSLMTSRSARTQYSTDSIFRGGTGRGLRRWCKPVPFAALAITGNLTSGPITNRFGARVPVVLGQSCMVVGLIALIPATDQRSPWLVALCLVPLGVGGSLAMPSVTSVVLEGVPAERAGTASAVFNTFRQVGGAVAIAVFGALIAAPGAFTTGLRTSLLVAALLLTVTAALSTRIRPRAHVG